MDKLKRVATAVAISNSRNYKAKLDTAKFVEYMLNEWKTSEVSTFSKLEKAGIIKEDKKDEFTFWVGKTPIRAVGPGSGLYRMKWERQ